jgi:two-component system, NtrC family, sensor kinase
MRLSVTTKIFLGLAVIVVTFGLVSIYAVVQVHHIGRSLELTSRTYLPLTKLASQLETVQSHRSRDTGRLLEEREARVQTILISIARRHFPKVVREKLDLGTEIARTGRERSIESADAEFLAEVEAWLDRLGTLYDGYDATAEALYRLIEDGGAVNELGADGARLADELRRAERRIEREIKDLGRALEGKVTEQVRRTEAEESRVTFTILLLSLTAVLVAFAVILFAQRTLRPIRRLTEGVQDVRRGDFERRVDVDGQDEIADLAREFNAMARALAEREAELVSQRTALLRAERLAAVGQMAAQVSHEVRNPLSSIGLNAELMADELAAARFDDPARAEEARVLLQAIAAEVDRLTEITEEYLRFARMPRPTLEAEDVNAVVRDVLAFIGGEMRAAGIAVDTDLEADLPLALSDEGQLRQALLNLLRNAREALAGRPGQVRVTTRAEEGRVSITVADDGPGIPPEDRERIFDPFVSTKEGGTGLGLPLIQQIMTEHGGSVSCESEVGRGTTFRLCLRKAEAVETAVIEDADRQAADASANQDDARAMGSAGEGLG